MEKFIKKMRTPALMGLVHLIGERHGSKHYPHFVATGSDEDFLLRQNDQGNQQLITSGQEYKERNPDVRYDNVIVCFSELLRAKDAAAHFLQGNGVIKSAEELLNDVILKEFNLYGAQKVKDGNMTLIQVPTLGYDLKKDLKTSTNWDYYTHIWTTWGNDARKETTECIRYFYIPGVTNSNNAPVLGEATYAVADFFSNPYYEMKDDDGSTMFLYISHHGRFEEFPNYMAGHIKLGEDGSVDINDDKMLIFKRAEYVFMEFEGKQNSTMPIEIRRGPATDSSLVTITTLNRIEEAKELHKRVINNQNYNFRIAG